MQSNAIRSMWLSSLWEALHDNLEFGNSLPQHVLATCGFPSRSARGAEERRRPAELLVGEWRGNPEEHGILSIHPERMSSEIEVAKAIVWAAGAALYGNRGSRRLGIFKEGAKLLYTSNDEGRQLSTIIRNTLEALGEMPSGKGTMPNTELKQTTRNRLWTCPKHPYLKIRIASHIAGLELTHTPHAPSEPCGATLILAPPSQRKKGKV